MRFWAYKCCHVPTGQVLDCTMEALDMCDLLKLLNAYNAQQPGVWVYWA